MLWELDEAIPSTWHGVNSPVLAVIEVALHGGYLAMVI